MFFDFPKDKFSNIIVGNIFWISIFVGSDCQKVPDRAAIVLNRRYAVSLDNKFFSESVEHCCNFHKCVSLKNNKHSPIQKKEKKYPLIAMGNQQIIKLNEKIEKMIGAICVHVIDAMRKFRCYQQP